ncbi:P-loop containing nucleoside triphosphate hydrolase protein [Gaertneriomyces semiglobifer]|nr:P-loop containing nucleoside triphosphate hydrolase protein [Gaertneriomyces semiglobifer]
MMSVRDPREANITVVVRVRPRNGIEIRQNSSETVTTNGARGKEVHIKTNAGEATTRTYTFDKVFGQDADQSLVFSDVVAPMLKEVLMGYNCTIFAYGTGAGKTYTMEGDLASGKREHAGVIPRTLYALFDSLEGGDLEYSVRVSFIELYNEELKDLLSSEEDARKLRIYEDYNKKGSVVIQGIEETLVKNAQDVISVLQRGSNKRQIAATNMNETSSRSHSIFCITVHIKETTPEGEELVKVGKLNLVDLAGSENIMRSGAKHGRAKEAGMINQSLLTLGRVINALVDRSPHVPYRESKLTRLLQDSLGGRTKTCIIAAVSPAKCNIEETMSTLDYAHRAKNIRNKPEINQRMTKRALLRDYEETIQRLKADLMATQSKNGIFLSPESHAALLAEAQGGKVRTDELAKALSAKEEEMKTLTEQLQQNLSLLDVTKAERDATRVELEGKRRELEETFAEMRAVQQSLSEQTLLASTLAATETKLDNLAAGLVGTLKSSVSDVEGLHDKLERKSAVEAENMAKFQHLQTSLLAHLTEVDERVGSFNGDFQELCHTLSEELKKFAGQQNQTIADAQKQTEDLGQNIVKTAEELHSNDLALGTALSKDLDDIQHVVSCAKTAVLSHEEKVQATHVDLFNSHKDLIHQHQQQILHWKASLQTRLGSILGQVRSYYDEQLLKQQELHHKMETSMQREIAALKERNEELQQALSAEREQTAQATGSLMSDISQLVAAYANSQAERFSHIENATRERTDAGAASFASCFSETKAASEDMAAFSGCFANSLMENLDGLEKDVEVEVSSLDSTAHAAFEQCGVMERTVKDDSASTKELVLATLTQVENKRVEASQTESKRRTIQQELTDSIKERAPDAFQKIAGQMSRSNKEILKETSKWADMAMHRAEWAHDKHRDIQSTIKRARDETESNRLDADESTGSTPRKRTFKFATSWQVTRDHDEILQEYRENGRLITPPTTIRSYDELLSQSEKENDEYVDSKQDVSLPATPKWSKLPRTRGRKGGWTMLDSPLQLRSVENVEGE